MALFKGLFVNKKTGEDANVPSNLAAVVSKTRDKDGRIELQINVATPESPQAGGSSAAASTADILNTLTQETSVNINSIVNTYEDLFEDDEDPNSQRADSEELDDEVTCNQKVTGLSGQVYTQKDIYNAQLSLALLRQTRNVLDMNHSHLKQGDVRNKDVIEKYNEALVLLLGSENKAMNLLKDMKSTTQFNWVRFLKTHARRQQQVLQQSGNRKGKQPIKGSSSSDSNKKKKVSATDTTVPEIHNQDNDPDDDPSSSSDSSDSDSDDDFVDAPEPRRTRRRTAAARSASRDGSGKRGNDMPLVKFDGKDDVAGWIHQMELAQDDMGWLNRKLCRVALRCLDKTAAVWLQTLHKRGFTFSSWKGSNGLRKRLETRFGECTKGVGRTYQTMLQKREETVEQFYDRASQAVALRDRKWKRSYDESQRDLCGVLLGGFPQQMLDAIGDKLEDQADPDKMLRIAKGWEKKKGKEHNQHQQQGKSKNKNTNATNSDAKNWCRNCPQADHLWKDCPKRNKQKEQQQQASAAACKTATTAQEDFQADFQL